MLRLRRTVWQDELMCKTTFMNGMEIVLLILSLFASVLVSSSTSSQTCSSPLVGVVDGNVRLGFLFPFFGKDGDFCSSEPIAENIALVEAAIYAVKNIPDASKIPGVSIGLEAFDSCSSHKVGGQHVLNYIDNQLYNINGSLCSDVILRPGIIGPMIDEVTQYVSPLLSYQNIPLIVYGEATSSEFTENRDIHSSFFSLAPSEKIQVQVIVDLLWNMNWNYVAVMYSETMETTFDKLLTNANDAGICLAERVRVTSQIQDTFENGIMKILRNSDIKVVVLLLEDTSILSCAMEAISSVGDSASYLQWVSNVEPTLQLQTTHKYVIRGLVSMKYTRQIHENFKTYLSSLNPSLVSKEENPWFARAWENMNECDLSQDGDYGVPCNKSTEFTSETFNNVDVIVSNIIDAVFIYAEALAKLHQELCGETVGICERFGSAAGQSLLSTLLTDDFTGALNQTIVFKDNGEPKHVEFDIHNVQLDNNGNSTLVKVGEWNTDTGITLDINNLQLWNSSTQLEDISISTCPDSCTICLSSSAKSFIIYGDVIFAGMFSIHDVNCSVFKTSGYVRMQAMLYAIQTINNNENILPNVTIGMEAYDTCSDSRIAGSQTYQFTSGFQQTEELFMNREQSGNQQYAIGAIGADRNDLTRSVNQQLAAVDMVQIGQLSTASTADLVNFYHVVGTDQKQARVLVDVLLQAEYKYIQILEGQYANEAVKTLKDLAAKADIFVANSIVVDEDASFDDDVIYKLLAYPTSDVIVVFLEFQEVNQFLRAIDRAGLEQTFQILASDKWGLDSSAVVGVKSVAKNSITISPKSLVNSEFESYFTGLQPNNSADPWFAEFWMGRYNCQLPGQPILYDELCTDSDVLSATDAQSRTISSVIDAVYVLSTALDMLIRDKCPEVGTICKDLQSVSMDEWLSHINETMVESLSGSDVAFDENGQVNSAVYDVNKFEELNSEFGYQTIGSWKDGVGLEGLNVAEFENVASECPYKTLPCSNENPKLSIIDGDIVIPALFSTHTAGSSALRCGSLNLEEVVAVQALIYAMDKINGDNNILPGLNLGAAVADYCGSTLMAYDQFVNIVGNSSRYGHDFAVIGPVDSVVASAIVPNAVNILGFTAISPSVFDNESASTSSAPYHIFTKQSQLPTFSTLKELVIYFNWTYIAIVYTDADYERFQAEQFTKEIEYLGVCIAVNKGIPEDGSRLQFDGIISEISTSEVGVAVAFLSDGHFSMLLESRATFGTNEANVMWVGSFPSIHDVTAFKNSPIATLSTRRQYKYDLTEFETYLKNINPLDDHGNPWFREYFEILANCRLEDEFTSPVPICEKGLTLTSVDESLLRISDLVAETIKSVYMIAQAAHNRLSTLCKENAMSICREFLEPDSKGIYNTLANVEIHPPISEESIKFNEGEIEDEIVIFNQIGDQNAKEIQVGSILSGTLLIDVTKIKSYDINGNLQEGVRTSTCPVGTLCNCKTSSPETTGETNEPDDSESIVWNVEGYWVTIVLAASATFAALILLVAGYLFYYRRHTVVIEASLNLSIWLIIGLILMYVMNLPFMVKPTVIVCGIRRVGVSFVYAIVFSALSVKIIRINRLRRRLVPEEPIGFIGASSQTLFFFVFLMAEIVLVVEWLILEHPSTVLNSNNETLCSFEKLDLVISLSYACFLVLFSLISSFGALSSSSVNSEARFIFLACVSTICCVIAWTCVYVLSDDTDYEVASVCVGLTLNSTLIFIAIFVPKVNVLCNVYSAKNERPVRNSKMGQAYANTALHTNEEEALTNL